MTLFRMPGQGPQPGVTRGDKRKIVLLLGGFVLALFAFAWSFSLANRRAPQPNADVPAAAAPEESVFVPRIDPKRLDALVADREPVDRVVLEGAALDELLPEVRKLTPRHYEALHAEELSAERCAALLADPRAARGQAFFARGRIDSIRTRRRDPAGEVEHIGRLLLEDDGVVYFLVLDAPEDGGFVRVDGLFLKAYSDESDMQPGVWKEGPLLVGTQATRSYADLGPVEAPNWELYRTIEDADLVPEDGSEPKFVRESPFDPFWHLMAYARDLPPDSIDWERAPELDAALVAELLEDPVTWRAQPVRVPLSQIQGVQVKAAGENPARIDSVTEGWLGHTTWKNVVHFQAPGSNENVALRDLVEGRGFFLHDFAYESQGRGLRVAPVIVLHSLSVYVPPKQVTLFQIGLAISVLFIASIAIFAWLLWRDRRRAREFEQELVRRRRARRSSLPSAP